LFDVIFTGGTELANGGAICPRGKTKPAGLARSNQSADLIKKQEHWRWNKT